jgi:hypothetical protein
MQCILFLKKGALCDITKTKQNDHARAPKPLFFEKVLFLEKVLFNNKGSR